MLVGLLLWRLMVLQNTSEAEDRADQTLVAASMLGRDLMHLQNQERGYLLTGSSQAFGKDIEPTAVSRRFAELERLVGDPPRRSQLAKIEAMYLAWLQNANELVRERRAGNPRPYSAQRVQIEQTHALNMAAADFLAEQRDLRELASDENDLQVRIVVICAVAGSLLVGAVLICVAIRLLRVEAEQRRRSNELAEENVRISEAARVKSEFVAHMSHEFRTPLTAILGYGELLYDEKAGPLNATQKEYLGDVIASGHHLLGLINQVLDLAKLEAGKISMRYERCDPRRLADDTAETLRAIARERNVTLRVDSTQAPASAVTDPGRFRQILYNYLSNAIAFSPNGGTVTMRVRRTAPARYRVEVTDDGPGIAQSDIPKLFKEFSQVDSGTMRGRDGAGLGLALTKRIVEAHGGTVGVESRLGGGSTFFAELPVDRDSASEEVACAS